MFYNPCVLPLKGYRKMHLNSFDSTYDYSLVTETQWKFILDRATKWKFSIVREAAIRSLRDSPLEPLERIRLWKEYSISNYWVQPAFLTICMRQKPLSLKEGRIVGLDGAILIAEAREKLRVEWGYGDLPEEAWRGTASDIVKERILPFSDTRSFNLVS
jgi:hypothetical protein